MKPSSDDLTQDCHLLGGAGGDLRVGLGDPEAQAPHLHHTQTRLPLMTSTHTLRKVKISPLRHTRTSFAFKAHQLTNVYRGALDPGPVQPADLALLPASHLPPRHSPLGHRDFQTRRSWVRTPQPRLHAGGDRTAPSHHRLLGAPGVQLKKPSALEGSLEVERPPGCHRG